MLQVECISRAVKKSEYQVASGDSASIQSIKSKRGAKIAQSKGYLHDDSGVVDGGSG